jgi:hypothetical protein
VPRCLTRGWRHRDGLATRATRRRVLRR